MDNSCDNKQESDCDSLQETSEQEIEENVRDNKFVRSNDSDESQDSDSTLEVEVKTRKNSEDSNDYKKWNECQNINVTPDPNQTQYNPCLTCNTTGEQSSETAETQTKPQLKESSKENTTQKRRDSKIFTPKWGESVGFTDENGNMKRIVSLTEIKNYLHLKLKLGSMFKFYFSLIDSRYPQLFKSLNSGEQRWRMRYNIFVDGVFGSSKKCDSILHVGEIHIYFDIAKYLSHPYYVNCSFYGNYQPFKREIDSSRLTKMIVKLHSILTSNDMLQLKFPMPKRAFKNIDPLFFKFVQKQKDLMDALYLLNQDNHWIPNGKWLTIDPKYKLNDLYKTYDRRPISQRIGYRVRKYQIKRNSEEVARYGFAIGSKHQNNQINRSEEQPIHSSNKILEERIGHRFFATKTRNRSSNGRPRDGFRDEVYANHSFIPLSEKVSTNCDHKMANDKSQTKPFARNTYQRIASLDQNDVNNDSDVRAVKSLRSGRNGDLRSRLKTKPFL